jgi:hypothetical protein
MTRPKACAPLQQQQQQQQRSLSRQQAQVATTHESPGSEIQSTGFVALGCVHAQLGCIDPASVATLLSGPIFIQ